MPTYPHARCGFQVTREATPRTLKPMCYILQRRQLTPLKTVVAGSELLTYPLAHSNAVASRNSHCTFPKCCVCTFPSREATDSYSGIVPLDRVLQCCNASILRESISTGRTSTVPNYIQVQTGHLLCQQSPSDGIPDQRRTEGCPC